MQACAPALGERGGPIERGRKRRERWECNGTTALCFLCRSLLFFRARKMGLCNSHVISPEIVVGLQLLPLLLPAAQLLGFWQQPDRHTALHSPPASKNNNKKTATTHSPVWSDNGENAKSTRKKNKKHD